MAPVTGRTAIAAGLTGHWWAFGISLCSGRGRWARTTDFLVPNQVPYHWAIPRLVEVTGIEPASTECKSVALPLSYTPDIVIPISAAQLDWQEIQGTCEEAPEELQLAERLDRI